jgi:hypothetical protein
MPGANREYEHESPLTAMVNFLATNTADKPLWVTIKNLKLVEVKQIFSGTYGVCCAG